MMKIGLAGYSGSGVTTTLALFSEDVGLMERHGGPEIRSLRLADNRLIELAGVFRPKKTTPVHLDIVELGDLRPEEGGGLKRETVARAAGLEALAVVLRGFAAPRAPQCRPADELAGELSSLLDDFCLSDLVPVENRLERLAKEGKSSSAEAVLLTGVREHLEEGNPVRTMNLSREDERSLSGYQFLSRFPLMVINNIGEEGSRGQLYADLADGCKAKGISYLEICALSELELLDIEEEERGPFLSELGLEVPSRDRFISGMFDLLRLITFFTVGDREVKGWLIREGTKALTAAGKIHSDIERGFIRAEVIQWDECVAAGGLSAARESGRLRIEGKDYVLQEGEVFHVRFNV